MDFFVINELGEKRRRAALAAAAQRGWQGASLRAPFEIPSIP